MADDVVVFCREDLPTAAFPVIADIRRQGKLCDVTLKVGDQRFSAHRIILAASIPYFNAMFTHDMVEAKQGEICMQGIEPSALESLVNFAYDGRLQIEANTVQSLLIAASFLHLQCVKEACCEFLQNRFQKQRTMRAQKKPNPCRKKHVFQNKGLTCLIHLDLKITGKMLKFNENSWAVVGKYANRWKDLDGAERIISETHQAVFQGSREDAVKEYGYHQICYSRFNDKQRLERAEKRVKKVHAMECSDLETISQDRTDPPPEKRFKFEDASTIPVSSPSTTDANQSTSATTNKTLTATTDQSKVGISGQSTPATDKTITVSTGQSTTDTIDKSKADTAGQLTEQLTPASTEQSTTAATEQSTIATTDQTTTDQSAASAAVMPPGFCIICKKFDSYKIYLGRRIRDHVTKTCTKDGGMLREAATAVEDESILKLIRGRSCIDVGVQYHSHCYKKYVNVLDKKKEEVKPTELGPYELTFEVFSQEIIITHIIQGNEVIYLTRLLDIFKVMVKQKEKLDASNYELHPQNCLGVRSFADQYMCTGLVDAANKFIQNNFKQVSQTDEFLSLAKSEFLDIISRDELNVSNEEQVFEASISWVKKDLNTRKEFFPEVLVRLRLPLLTPQYLSDSVATESLVKSCLKCRDLLDEARDYHLMPERRPLLQTFKTKPRCCTDVPGMIYAVGGLTSSGESLSTVERYDPIVDRWKIAEAMSTMRSRVGVAVLEGRLYAIGGNDGAERLNTVEVFEPEKKTWKKVAPMNCKRSAQGAAALNGQLYVCGGYDGVSSLKSVEVYDPKTDVWAMITDMQKLRSAAGVAVLQGEIYACGGHDGLSIYDSVELYNTATCIWQTVAPMQSKRCRLGVAALNGKLYAAGGYDGSVFLRSVECYDPAENKWKFVASMNRKRSRVSLVATYGKLYAIGGYDGITNLNSVEYYDPQTDSWKFGKIMSAHEGGVGVGVIPIEEPE